MIQELLNKYIPEETEAEHLNIVTYELGSLVKCLLYANRYKDKSTLYLAYARTELGDLLVQLQLLCEKKGWNMAVLLREGAENMRIKLEEYQAHKMKGENVD